ncbi:MAG TPA: ABC-F family ATP-binding cassette domain-containing protein [Edaphocola sp.]|nr:ABC-F family ATP-binding cassette domain-containing protein [Edaphocola sp.]
MHYLSVENLSKSFVDKPLFEHITFHISEGDKIGLIALNGAGKSTLLKIISGRESPDEGSVQINKNVNVVLLPQKPVILEEASVIENIFNHDHPVINAIKKYERLTAPGNPQKEEAIAAAIQEMNEQNAWNYEAVVKQILGRLDIHNYEQKAGTLSGGQKKRLALAKVLIDMDFEHRHTLLILDEPTNHLDVGMIEWLEQYLSQSKATLLLVTHDRYFLDQVCTKILELNDRQIHIHRGDYEQYLQDKAIRMEADVASQDKARNRYKKELEWMRKQPRARGTKSRARQEAFYDWKDKATKKREDAQLELSMKMTRLGGKILDLKKVYKSFGEKIILKGFDYSFKKGERVGIIGPNGAGKSTFINILLQKEKADSGKINLGETIVFGDFSQEGLQYKEDIRVMEYVKNIAEFFPLADGTKISAAQFLERFLFTPAKQYTFLSKLSGGELKRLQLLSILFRNPNFLVLDEPTNDLDLPTLEILEEFLLNFPGCVIIVSHDRYFMDKVVDHLLVFEGNGVIRDFPGNYGQYREEKATMEKQAREQKAVAIPVPATEQPAKGKEDRRLSYKEKRELEQLDKDIAALTGEKKTLEAELSSGTLPYEELESKGNRLIRLNAELDEKEMRWLELSEIAEG